MHIKFWSEILKVRDHSLSHGRRWGDNIRMDVRETGWGILDWLHPTQDRDKWRALAGKIMKLRVP
jgi:hypothetical protein